MGIAHIIMFVVRAGIFALAVTAVWAVFHLKIKKQPFSKKFIFDMLFVMYISALYQITVIRNFGDFFNLADNHYSLSSIVYIPFATISNSAMLGVWPLVYHLVGNMVWFIPFGVYIAYLKKGILHIVVGSVALSLSIEVLQFVFNTGISDIDDVIANLLGAVLGYAFFIALAVRK